MKIITRKQLDKLVDFNDVFTKTKRAYQLFSQGKTITPPFTVFTIPEVGGSVHFKCGYVPGEKFFAMKYSGAFYGNEKLGLSNFLGLFTVFNSTTGEVEAVIDDKGFLTDYRTGVAGAIATSSMATKNSKVVAVIGSGVQARMQIHSLMKVMPFERLQVWSKNAESVNKYVKEIEKAYPNLKVVSCANAKEAVTNADIVYTVTYSEKPLIKYEWLKKGVHITAVGACEPHMQELHVDIFKHANIVCVDSIEATSKNGELHHALKAKKITKDKVIELGDFISSKQKRNKDDITVCDLVGIGFQDAVIASCVMQKTTVNKSNGRQNEIKSNRSK